MKSIFTKKNLIVGALLCFAKLSAADDAPSAVGYWQTIDDVTNQPRSIVKICQLNNNMLYGRIIQVNYVTGEGPTDKCDLCSTKDPRYNRPILGSIFLTDMHLSQDPNQFLYGRVLDPHNGKVYNAKITVTPNEKSLSLRGYIGIPLLGRTQTWTRIAPAQLNKLLGKINSPTKGAYATSSTGKFVASEYDSCKRIQKEFDAMSN
jgi:uncharacterized protein (DUF2147 family)